MKRQIDEAIKLQLEGYRLTTAEIIYRLPDHPALLQSFVWQHYDLQPEFPVLRRFLDYWVRHIEGKLHSVRVIRVSLFTQSSYQSVDQVFQIH